MLRTAFKLALRQTEGVMTSVLTLMGLTLSAPDHSTVSRRAVKLPVIQSTSVPAGPLHVLIDSTGLQVYGAGQWLEAKHATGCGFLTAVGIGCKRSWSSDFCRLHCIWQGPIFWRTKMAKTRRWQTIPTQLTLTEFEQFVLPHLVRGRRGPAPKLSLYKLMKNPVASYGVSGGSFRKTQQAAG
jgi:hypothetical protein